MGRIAARIGATLDPCIFGRRLVWHEYMLYRFLDVFSGMISAAYSIEVQQVGPKGPKNKASNEFAWIGSPGSEPSLHIS